MEMDDLFRLSEALRAVNEQIVLFISGCSELESRLDSIAEKLSRMRLDADELANTPQ